jgi:hypothetical protein
MAKETEKIINEVVAEMSEAGYDVTPDEVVAVLEHHRAVPMPGNAALMGNILSAFESRGVRITADATGG